MARELYEMQEWEDLPSENTPISGDRLSHIEQGVYDNSVDMALRDIYGDKYTNLGVGNQIGNAGFFALLGTNNKVENGSSYFQATGSGHNIAGSNHGCFGSGHKLSGVNNFLSGANNVAEEGNGSAQGLGLIAKANQSVRGRFNIEDVEHKYAEIVGNGNADAQRNNAYTLDWQGNATYAGAVESQGLILTDTETGQKYKLTIANGNVEITEVE